MDVFQLMKDSFRSMQDEVFQLNSEEGIGFQEVRNLCEELQIEIKVEEACLLPVIEKFQDKQEFTCNHLTELKALINSVQSDKRVNIKDDLMHLQEVLEAHVEETVYHMFPLMLENLSQDELKQLAEKIEHVKLQELRKRQEKVR